MYCYTDLQVKLFAIQALDYFSSNRISKIYMEDLHDYIISNKLRVPSRDYQKFVNVFSEYIEKMAIRFAIQFVEGQKPSE